jgi:hypothetical protein
MRQTDRQRETYNETESKQQTGLREILPDASRQKRQKV